MRKIITICIIGLFALNVQAQPVKTLKLSDKELLDKIKGGWTGQTIGVVFGAPTEFKFTGTYASIVNSSPKMISLSLSISMIADNPAYGNPKKYKKVES